MSIQVNCIDEHGILKRLKKEDKEAYEYILALKRVLVSQQDLTKKAISKIKELSRKDETNNY